MMSWNRSSRNNNWTIINPLFDIFGCWPFLKFINVFPELRPSGSIQFPQLPKLFQRESPIGGDVHWPLHVLSFSHHEIISIPNNDIWWCFSYAFRETLGLKVNCMEMYNYKFKFCQFSHALITCRQLWSLDRQAPHYLAGSSVPLIPRWQPRGMPADSVVSWGRSQSYFLFGTFVSIR